MSLLPLALALRLVATDPDPLAEARSALAAGDSARALGLLTRHVTGDGRAIGEAWHLRGLLAWRMAKASDARAVAAPKPGEKVDPRITGSLVRTAVLSLREATRVAPDSARYWITLGTLLTTSSDSAAFAAGLHAFRSGVGAGLRVDGEPGAATASEEIARLFRGRELAASGRRAFAPDGDVDGRGAPSRRDAALALEFATLAATPAGRRPGAERLLLAMHAEAGAWPALERAGRVIASSGSDRASGWTAVALARQRQDDAPGAEAAWARAATLLDTDGAQAASLARLLAPEEAAAFAALAPDERARRDALGWRLLDPMWASGGNELRAELVARAAHAAIRWGGGDPAAGLATAPGELLARLGPPRDVEVHAHDGGDSVAVLWLFPDGARFLLRHDATGERWWFPRMLSGATWAEVRAAIPQMTWSNVPTLERLRTMAVHAARFRAGERGAWRTDSAELVVAAIVPVRALVGDVDVRAPRLPTVLRIEDATGRAIVHDSSLTDVGSDTVQSRTWRRRIPAGAFLTRVEAWQPESGLGARGGPTVSWRGEAALPLDGFGISDVLLVRRASPREGIARRWSDLLLVPNAGEARRGDGTDVVVEVYAPGIAEGEHRYEISVTMNQLTDAPAGSIGRQLENARRNRGQATTREVQRVLARFERRLPARGDVVTEYLHLDLAPLAPGRYGVMVRVRDLVTGAVVERAADLHVVD